MNLEYSYRELLELCDEKKLHNISARISELYANHLTKNWTTDINSEWVCRNYLAAKMILNATVILNALNFSEPPTTGAISLSFATSVNPVKSLLL